MSENPLFISVLNTPISQPSTSMSRTQRGSRGQYWCLSSRPFSETNPRHFFIRGIGEHIDL